MSSATTSTSTYDLIEPILRDEGFEHFGIAELKIPLSIGLYEDWLARGLHGEMSYLERHLPQKRSPELVMKRAHSAIVMTLNYVPHPDPMDRSWPLSSATKVASYAKGKDYHHAIRTRLERAIEKLKTLFPNEDFKCFTDSGPVLERDLAARAGLGWVGKNTCLISRKAGSLFLIAEIYTSLKVSTAEVLVPDHCGTCTRCLDACPTGALLKPRELDARRCISYLTIESRQLPPEELRPLIGDWFFGCDICQTVCPWNRKILGQRKLNEEDSKKEEPTQELENDLRLVLRASNRELERLFAATPLSRAGGFGLKRNAIVVATNQNLTALIPEIEALQASEKLRPLAEWAIARLKAPRSGN